MLTKLTLEGFKSFRKLELELRDLNVLIGANGAGKSNFISVFRLVNALVLGHLQQLVGGAGGSDAFLRHGKKVSKHITLEFRFRDVAYQVGLRPDKTDTLRIHAEGFFRPVRGVDSPDISSSFQIGQPGARESALSDNDDGQAEYEIVQRILENIGDIRVFHFVDTTSTAAIKSTQRINNNLELSSDGGNLAAMLYLIQIQNPKNYQTIRDVIRSVAPYFDDFLLRPNPLNKDSIQLEWREQGSDFPFLAKDLSDGTLRFMALVTLLLQPNPPAITVIDEPELGLHPFAIEKLAGLLQIASSRTQLIVATQSPQLIAALEPEDVIVADRENGETTLRRLDATALEGWLEEYTLGELWQKNILGGVVNPNPVRSRSNS